MNAVRISYSDEDEHSGRTLSQLLADHRIGDRAQQVARSAPQPNRAPSVPQLPSAKCLIVLWSKHAVISKTVRRAMLEADLEQLPIIAVRLDQTALPKRKAHYALFDLRLRLQDPLLPMALAEAVSAARRMRAPRGVLSERKLDHVGGHKLVASIRKQVSDALAAASARVAPERPPVPLSPEAHEPNSAGSVSTLAFDKTETWRRLSDVPPFIPPQAMLHETRKQIVQRFDATPIDAVYFRVAARCSVSPGQEFGTRFVVYAAGQHLQVQELLKGVDEHAAARPERSEAHWPVGTLATVACHGEHVVVDPPTQRLSWQGHPQALDFDVKVAGHAPVLVETRLKFDVFVDGFNVARLRIPVALVSPEHASAVDAKREATVSAARTAFASYASEDRDRVLDRVASVRIAAGLDVWLDCLSLRPSDRWRDRLGPAIAERDLFLLFWSTHAAQSEWVELEWRMALEKKGLDAMQLHPLENVPALLPKELEDLHASDPLMAIRG